MSYYSATNHELFSACPIKRMHEGRFIPCRRQKCPCQTCRHAWAKKLATIRQRSFAQNPPTHTLVFRPPSIQSWLTRKGKFLDRLKYEIRRKRNAQLEYTYQVEYARHDDDPHIHLDLMTSIDTSELKRIVKSALVKTFEENLAVYCEPVKNPQGLARYIPKHLKTQSPNPVPAWIPPRKRLTSSSKRFFIKPQSALWQEAIREWYPAEQSTPDARQVHDDQPRLNAPLKPLNAPRKRCKPAKQAKTRPTPASPILTSPQLPPRCQSNPSVQSLGQEWGGNRLKNIKRQWLSTNAKHDTTNTYGKHKRSILYSHRLH